MRPVTYPYTPPNTPRPRRDWRRQVAEAGFMSLQEWHRARQEAGFYERSRQSAQIDQQLMADQSSLTQQNMTRGSTSVRANKALVQKSSMIVSGKTKVKRKPSVNVPSKLRKQIKQVMVGASASGSYIILRSGYIGSVWGTFSSDVYQTDMGSASQRGFSFNGGNQVPGRTLFNCLTSRVIVTPFLPTPVLGSALNYFTPAKILDAASVLFNKKPASINPYGQTNNLSGTTNLVTGLPNNLKPGRLNINILSSSVMFTMKNVSNRVVSIDIWECTPTLKFQDTNVLENVVNNMRVHVENTNDEAFQYLVGPSSSVNSIEPYFNPQFDFMSIGKKYQGLKWTWKKRSMVMAPAETCVHEIKGPKGMLDYKQLLAQPLNDTGNPVNSVYKMNTLLKGFSVSVLMAVHGDQVSTDVGTGGRKQYSTNASLSMPVHVEVVESFNISVPEVAGFITNAGLAGATQQLNLRQPKKIIYDTREQSQTAYTVNNEEQPSTILTSSIQN